MSADPLTVNPRERRREATRRRILDAAIVCFARSGFEATSISRVAERAGVKKALVQYHFNTKDQLWQDAATDLWRQRNEAIAAFTSLQQPAVDSLRMTFTTLVEFTQAHPEWLWFMFNEASTDSPRRTWLIQHCLLKDYRMGQDFVANCQQLGLMREGTPLQLLHLLTGALTYNLLVAPQTLEATGVDLASRESISEQVDLLLALLAP